MCARLFVSGDEFLLIDMRLYCRACHEVEIEHSRHQGFEIIQSPRCTHIFCCFFNILLWSINNFTKKSRKSISVSRSRSKKQTKDNPVRGFIRRKNYNTIVSSLVWIKLYSVETNGSVRTVLNEKQLHTLRTCYQANPRPDALMKEQLVEMTGLSPRVIRVWFQNKR